ncbi:hypothetical protein JW960_26980 [candidate division KSB1 bacterium]|nr:hypothetical protein [candidate division KSB1 bacterium]
MMIVNKIRFYRAALLFSITFILTFGSNLKASDKNIKIVNKSDHEIIYELLPYKLEFNDKIINGQLYTIPFVKGLELECKSNYPQLPVKGILVEIPGNATPTLQILSIQTATLFNKNIPPTPRFITEEKENLLYEKEIYLFNNIIYQTNGFFPEEFVSLTSIQQFRNKRMVRVELHPLKYNPATKELMVVNALQFSIRFESQNSNVGKRNDLSAPQLKDRSSQPRSASDMANRNLSKNSWYNPDNTYYKLSVADDAIYKLDYHYLDSLGISNNEIDPTTFQLFNQNQEVPIYVKGQQENIFNYNDYIIFYGHRNRAETAYYNAYSDTNIYWLTWGNDVGSRLQEKQSVATYDIEIKDYQEELHIEYDKQYHHGDNDIQIYNTEQAPGEGWIWRYLYAGESESINIPVDHISEINNICTFTSLVKGTATDPVNPDHHLSVSLNGTLIGELKFDNTETQTFETTFTSDLLRIGNDNVEIRSVGDTGANLDQFYLDWIELSYPRKMVAQNGQLEFKINDLNSNANFKIWGFQADSIVVLDQTSNALIKNPNIQKGNEHSFKVISAGFSDGNYCKIYADGEPVIPYGLRGHNLAVIDEQTGQLLETRNFDTFLSVADADSMAGFIQQLPTGRIVLAGIRDEGSVSMTEAAYQALESLGSTQSRSVGGRDSWAFIGWKGAPPDSVAEVVSKSGAGTGIASNTMILPGSGQEYYVSFNDRIDNEAYYVLSEFNKIKYPAKAAKDKPSSLIAANNGADYIIITHRKFEKYARKLAEFRQARNQFRTMVVDIEDIYDEFNYGQLDPQAIKKFLTNAYNSWETPQPQYVVLFGDASWDFKQNLPNSIKKNYVPSYGNPVSDNWYVCLNGPNDFLPDIYIGRIPVETEPEAESVVDKIISYEDAVPAAWTKNILFITGGFDHNEQNLFMNQSDYIKQNYVVPPPMSGNALSINKTAEGYFEGEKKDEILNAFDKGILWANFIGHAGSHTWDLMFNYQDIEELQNDGMYPFVTSMTCHTGRFANPEVTNFGERFLIADRKGAIAFWGTSGWGYIFQDNILLKNLFEAALVDTTQRLGNATTFSKLKLWETYGESIYNISAILQYNLLGDPVTDLAIPNLPDIAISNRDIHINPAVPTEADSTVIVTIKFHNWGLATNDSFKLELVDTKDNNSTLLTTYKIPHLGLIDSTRFHWSIKNQAGQHILKIQLDAQNEIYESNEENNTLNFPVYIHSSRLTISKPVESQVISPQNVILQVNNPVLENSYQNLQFQFEIAQDDNFDSIEKIASPLVNQGNLVTQWRPPAFLGEGTYFWRCRTNDGTTYGDWVTSSFTISSNTENIWSQHLESQLAQNQFHTTEINNNGVTLGRKKFVFDVESAGYSDGNYVRIFVNNKAVIEDSRGHNVAVINPGTGDIIATMAFDTWESTDDANAMATYLNGLPDGTYVLIAIMDEGSNSITDNAYQALEAVGSKFCRQVGSRDSWAMVGIKGAEIGTVKELHKKMGDGPAVVQDTMFCYDVNGTIASLPIGAANRWNDVSWLADISEPGTDIKMNIVGLNRLNSHWDTLRVNLTNSSGENISAINSRQYPKIKLLAHLTDDDGLNTPILKSWSVSYDPVPDMAIGPETVTLSADSVLVGENIDISATVYNIGMTPSDSMRVRFLFQHPDSGEVVFEDILWREYVAVDSMVKIHTTWSSAGFSGANQITIKLDPDNQINELSEDNNYFSKQIFVLADTSAPQLAVTFDGKTLIHGDYVSSNPLIDIRVTDNSTVLINGDTSKIKIILDDNELTYDQPSGIIQFIPIDPGDTTTTMHVQISPTLADGNHTIQIVIKDAGGNPAIYFMNFTVVSDLRLINVLNYPNPFQESTWFTFTLTQPAEEIIIKIFTVSGRMIQQLPTEMCMPGFNRIYWDGRDADGDVLANGVYLYKVVARHGDESEEVVEKMVLMR